MYSTNAVLAADSPLVKSIVLGMLSKMRYGNMEYDDAKRKEYQSKMRALREKWEKRGERFQHSENEDWLGK
jgi:hypothetical protein